MGYNLPWSNMPAHCYGLVITLLVKTKGEKYGEHADGRNVEWGGKEKENEEISHIKCRLIQHSAIIETANALQRQCNPRCQKAITCS